MAARFEPTPSPLFQEVVNAIVGMSWRPELSVEEIPAPAKIAPFSVAISAEVEVAEEELGSGRLVLLHDPAGSAAWEGEFRCVTYARAEVDAEMAIDPLITEVGWSWLLDALERNHAAFIAPSGTVTTVASRSFGGIATDGLRAEIELRASWTPLIECADDLVRHLESWADLVCQTAGLPPLPEGVVPIASRRAGSWLR
ncbi:Protein of unknown function (DUF3000) [Propionicimonas paludicola]|uniref:DUF3000 family protein n=1 Tax=Propionicimonas paludicola TaxID=185243 RepID=A0A2A9CQ77_9ACTN|nr:DUF3000 domain-containing protein [Propionicimonas paludicola]PFG16617.1 Protein of unknown function (DUF3000) [Propionicimonas paludicola]